MYMQLMDAEAAFRTHKHELVLRPIYHHKENRVDAHILVGFLAYVNVTGHVDLFAGMLFYFGLFLFVLLSWRVFRRPVPFAPSWWAISFPMAAAHLDSDSPMNLA